jgi:hypothetical protein
MGTGDSEINEETQNKQRRRLHQTGIHIGGGTMTRACRTFESTSVARGGFLNSFWKGSRVASVPGKPFTENGTP